jgi:HlyD family secretion protein
VSGSCLTAAPLPTTTLDRRKWAVYPRETAPASLALVSLTLVSLLSCHGANDSIPIYVVQPINFSRRVTADGNLKARKATPLTAPTDAQGPLKIAWVANDGTLLKKDDLVVRFDPTEFETALVNGREDHDTAVNKLTKTVGESATTRKNLGRDARQAEDELAAAKRFNFDDAEVFSRYQRIESELDQRLAGEKRTHANNVMGVREQLSRTDRDLVGIESKKADLKIRNAQQGLQALELRAPYDGILVLQRDWRGDVPRVGATVWSGSPIGEIPDLSTMKAEVFVLEADAAGIAVGQKARVALESNSVVTYGGKISQIDKLARPRMRGVPVQYFGVTLDLDRTDPIVMKPGARVRAVLEVENRTNAFSIPRQALFEKNGKKMVYVKRRDRFTPSEVTIGTSSPGRVVVTRGVAKGDALALTDPTKKEDEKEDKSAK